MKNGNSLRPVALLSLTFMMGFGLFAQDSPSFDIFQYRNVGPPRGGRVTTVAGVASQPGTFYMGATGGGVWKTEDYGTSWNNVSDGYFASPSIGDINVAQYYPQIVYVGTGSDGLRSNVIAGKGMYKSMDAGKTWQHIGLEQTGHIGAVEIHPYNADIVFVAAIGQAFQPNKERGVYRTKDGGQSWEQVLFLSDTIGAADLEFHPANPDIIYATAWRAERKPWTIISGSEEDGVYKSTDGGDTWKKLEKGLPEGLKGKIDLAVSPAHPDLLYALVEAPAPKGGLYRSNDQGESFKLASNQESLVDRPFYYCNVEADPTDAETVYVLSTAFWKSTNGGQRWSRLNPPHGDNHDMWINPNNPQLFIQCNDGGANVTFNGGRTWSSQFNQPTAELYTLEVDDQYPYWLYAGQQDNYTTIAVPSLPPYGVQAGDIGLILNTGGCETGPAVPKPGNPDIVYSNCKGRFGVYNKKTGQEMQYYVGASNMYGHNPNELEYRFQRVSPIHVSPHNPDVVYHTSQFVHKTTDDGRTWETISPDLTAFEPDKQVISGEPITRDITGEEFYSTIYAIRESTLEEGLIWVGANDGPVHVTRNGGKKWNDVTPRDLLPGGRVDCVEPSPHDPSKAYVAVLRYQLGDWKPYIYKTSNYGRSWTLLTDGRNGIPADYPTRVVREDPDREGVLYAGTEFGMFVSLDDGESWQSFQQNLPVTPITDIKVFRKDVVLSTMGRSFWILDNVASLTQDYVRVVSGKEPHLFQPADAFRYRHRGNSRNSIPHYPAAAAPIDYYLPEDAKSPLRLDILNEKGEIVRSFLSKDGIESKANALQRSMATGFWEPTPNPGLSAKAGVHRFAWNMEHAGAWDQRESRRYAGGPMVAPGTYKVRLTVDGDSQEQTFRVLLDPRVEESGVSGQDVEAQVDLSLKAADLMSEAKKGLAAVEKERKSLAERLKEEETDQEAKVRDEKLKAFEAALETAEGRYMKPMLIPQISYLYFMLNQADQRPGRDAYERYEELRAEWEALKGRIGREAVDLGSRR